MSDNSSLIDQCPETDREAIYVACRVVALWDDRVWREVGTLDRIGDRLQIPQKTRAKIRRKVKSRRCRVKIPDSDAGKRLMFEFAVQVAAADDKLTDREQKYARRLGKRLGLTTDEIEQRLERCADLCATGSASGDWRIAVSQQDGTGRVRGTREERPAQRDTLEEDLCGLRCSIKDAVDADRANIFAHVRASSTYINRESAERIRRVPRTPLSFMLAPMIVLGIFLLVGFGIAISPLFASQPKLEDVRAAMFLGTMVGGFPGAIMLFLWFLRRRFDAGVVTSRTAIVVGQHTIDRYYEEMGGWSHSTEGHRVQQVTFMAEDGRTFQHKVRRPELASRMNIGDAGALFLRRDWAVDFDCVLTGEQIRDGQMVGALICGSCDTIHRVNDAPEYCRNCGAEVPRPSSSPDKPLRRPYSRWTGWLDAWVDSYRDRDGYVIPQPSIKHRVEGQVTCGWCRCTYSSRPASPNCEKCGGTLPMPPGSDPGPEPLDAPRRLPTIFVRDLFLKSRDIITTAIMFVCSILCCPLLIITLPCFVLGTTGLIHSLLKAFRRWTALARGTPVLGKIDYVEHFGNEFRADQNQNYRVTFRFEVDGEHLQGVFETTDNAITKHYTGEPIWVVYVRGSPHVYATWPPFS